MGEDPVLAERGAVRLVWRQGGVWAVMRRLPEPLAWPVAPAWVEDSWAWEAESLPDEEWERVWQIGQAQDDASWARDAAGLYWLAGPDDRGALVAWLAGDPAGAARADVEQWWACGRDADGIWLAPVDHHAGAWEVPPGWPPARLMAEDAAISVRENELLTMEDERWAQIVRALVQADQARRRAGRWPPCWAPEPAGSRDGEPPRFAVQWQDRPDGEADVVWPDLVAGDAARWRVRPATDQADPGITYCTQGAGVWTLAIHREGLRWQDAEGRRMRRLTEDEGWALRQLWARGPLRRPAWAARVRDLLTAGEWTADWWEMDICTGTGRHERAPRTGWLLHLQEGEGAEPVWDAVWSREADGRGEGDRLTWRVGHWQGWVLCYQSGEIEVQGATRRCWVLPECRAIWLDARVF